MSLTTLSLQAYLSTACGGTLTAAGLDGSTTSAAWLGPIAAGVRSLGLALVDPLSAVDADLVPVVASQVDQLLDVAELRALENALNHYTKVSQKISMGEKRFGEFRTELEATIARKSTSVMNQYGIGLATISAGVIDLAFDSVDSTA